MSDPQDWPAEKILMEKQFKRMARDLNTARSRALHAHDKMIADQTRAHDLKLRARAAENSVSALQQDAMRYRWLKKNGCEYTLGLLRRWETDIWDDKIDKARGAIR